MPKSPFSEPVLTVAEIEKLLDEVFPQLHHGGRTIMVEAVAPMTARLRLIAHERHLRPGGTVSGPAMFTLADVGIWVAIFSHMGQEALAAVTTNLNINFLRKPPHGDVIVECRLLKLGKRLAVGEATLFAAGADEPVAHAVGTYSIPAAKHRVS
jgi:uncharacterized protein (TIGR00369 family)